MKWQLYSRKKGRVSARSEAEAELAEYAARLFAAVALDEYLAAAYRAAGADGSLETTRYILDFGIPDTVKPAYDCSRLAGTSLALIYNPELRQPPRFLLVRGCRLTAGREVGVIVEKSLK